MLSGCTQHHALRDPQHANAGPAPHVHKVAAQKEPAPPVDALYQLCDAPLDSLQALPELSAARTAPAVMGKDAVLSPGDLIEVVIENGEGFSGRYVVSPQGGINLPYLHGIRIRGLDVYQVAEKIELALVRAEMFQAATISVNVQVLEWAEIDVVVSGAVFQPGRHYINKHHAEGKHDEKTAAFGDYRSTRLLTEALRAASGIRPDAMIERAVLVRNGWHFNVDLGGVLSGDPVLDVPLIAGDKVIVPSIGCVRQELVRPSQITPKGFRVFMSNLTESANSNANAAVGRFSSNLPYGARLLQAAVSANCVGGGQWTDAPRKVVVASTDPISGDFRVVERSVEALMRFAHDDTHNPLLMPNDAVACYDSDITNIRDLARFMLDIINPLRAL